MAEDNIVVKTIENVDKLFSQIVVNGEVFESERYVEPEPKPAVVKKALLKKAEVKRSTVQTEPQNTTRSENTRSIQGENVYAVELNDILHNFEDRAIVQALSEETHTRASADEHLQQSITDINGKIPSTASSSNKLADSASVGASINNAIGALDVASAGGNGKYIKSISETDGKISAVTGNIDSSVNEGSSNPVTGGAVDTVINVVKASVEDIEALIPNQATEQNQLADKAFVNSSIATNTANFLGTYTSLAQIQAIPDPTNNDYAYLQTTDSAGNTLYQRYKYSSSDSQWHYEYTLNNSSFTAEQWATINSGLTQASVTAELGEAISGEVTARNTAISSAINTEVSNRNTAISNAIAEEVSNRNTAISNAVEALDVASAGGNGKYIKAISETDGKISATTGDIDSSVTSGSSNPVTGGAVATALNDKVDKVTGKGLSTNDFTDALKNKLNGIEAGAQVNTVTGVKGSAETNYRTGDISISKSDIGLGNVVNTGDSAVPSENGTEKFTTGGAYTELNKKADKSSLALPTDAVLHYSFDDVPDYPDGTAVYFRNRNFTSADNWHCGNGTVTYNNGIVKVVTAGNTYIYKNINFSNCVVKLKVKSAITDVVKVYTSGAVSEQNVTLQANELTELVFYFAGDCTAIGITEIVSGNTIEIYAIYIGDGSYSTPIIDNANGQFNATNNGGIAVQGVSGKGAYFLNGKYANIGNDFQLNANFTVSLWVKPDNNTNGLIGNIIGKEAQFILRNGADWGNYLMLYIYDDERTNIVSGSIGALLSPIEWTHLVITRNGTTCNIYKNGVKTHEKTLANNRIGVNNNPFFCCRFSTQYNTRPQSIDDLLIFDRALSDTEVQALYLNKANTPKYFPTPTNEIKEGSLELATSGGVANAINALDVASVGGDGKYISAISETDGKISAIESNMSTSPTKDSIRPITSGGVFNAEHGGIGKSLSTANWYKIAEFGRRNVSQVLEIDLITNYNNTPCGCHHIVLDYGWLEANVFDFSKDTSQVFDKIKLCYNSNNADRMAVYVHYRLSNSNGVVVSIKGLNTNIDGTTEFSSYNFETDELVWGNTKEFSLGTDGLTINGQSYDIGKYLKGDLSQETLYTGDLNDIQYGNYFVSSASTNLPPLENSPGFLMALYRSSVYQEQLIFFPTTGNIYSRPRFNGTWGNWNGFQSKTLSTPITIAGAQQTTVEGALGALAQEILNLQSLLSEQ